MTDKMQLQRDEFDALDALVDAYQAMPAAVDDDYPHYRNRYEARMNAFILAIAANGRLARDPASPDAPRAPDERSEVAKFCNLTTAAQMRGAAIIASAHALYYHRARMGADAAAREAAELLEALDHLVEAAKFLRKGEG